MTAIAPSPIVSRPSPPAHAVKGGRLSNLLRAPGGLVAGTGPRQGPNDPDAT